VKKLILALLVLYSGLSASQTNTSYNSPYVGIPSQVFSTNPAAWAALPQAQNNSDLIIGANYAWSRGWTGKGSTILIMDTGIDLANPAFSAPGKIIASKDFSGTTMQDNNGHGSNVAGIAAGAFNKTGVMGVAFDADLAIAKLSNTGSITNSTALTALKWANTLPSSTNIVVANLSANTGYSTAYTASMTKLSPGIYASNDKNYGGAGYYNGETPQSWAAALNPRMVLTISAGNTGLSYVQNPATFANATDANGNLVLNGQMLVVGNWNDKGGRVEGDLAGTVCKNVVAGVCRDLYKTSDFYILAPGAAVNGPVPTSVNKSGFSSMSGTSQAAPAVAGAVAIVSQLWPYMTAANQVQLLLKTANKNLPNYDVNTMGQGLLDLNRATQPLGNLAISLTGRTGTALPISGGITVSNVSTTAVMKLSSVSAVDNMQRDFTVNLSPAMSVNTIMRNPVMIDADPGANWSGRWTGLMAGQNLQMPVTGAQYGAESTVSLDSRIMNPDAIWSSQFTMTTSQYNPFVGLSGMFGQTNSSTTLEYSKLYRPGEKEGRYGLPQGWWAQGGVMTTVVNYNSGMVNNITPIVSVHAMGGYQLHDWNLFAGVKPVVAYGQISMTAPTAVDAEGNMSYSQVRNSLVGGAPITYAGVKYQHNFKDGQTVGFRSAVASDGSRNARVYYSWLF
jgi:subtilisin family serine protease